jgi:hypothetical protein
MPDPAHPGRASIWACAAEARVRKKKRARIRSWRGVKIGIVDGCGLDRLSQLFSLSMLNRPGENRNRLGEDRGIGCAILSRILSWKGA